MSLDLLAAFLKTVGAFQTRHSGKTLGHHLLGTYALLADAGCSEETCLAGGLHSIYGTTRFKHATLDMVEDYERVAVLFGNRAEELVALFSQLSPNQIEAGVTVRQTYLPALRLVTAANILEQGGSLDRWPRIKATWLAQLEATHEARSEA